jgi:hypothetical protein
MTNGSLNEGMGSVNVETQYDLSRIKQLAGIANASTVAGTPVVFEDDSAEYDDEAGMAHNSLKTMQRAVEGLATTIQPGDNLPEWCQEKLSLAEDYLVSVWDYLQSEKDTGQ